MTDDLLARIQRLEEDNRRLSELVDRLSTHDTPEPDDSPVNRRRLLKRTAAVALGVTAVGTAGQLLNPRPAAAVAGEPIIMGWKNISEDVTTYEHNRVDRAGFESVNYAAGGGIGFIAYGSGTGMIGSGNLGPGVIGLCPNDATHYDFKYHQAGVLGVGRLGADGVRGNSTAGTGVTGESTSGTGVLGKSTRFGVHGMCSTNDGNGVVGESLADWGNGVEGHSPRNAGVAGFSTCGAGIVGVCTRVDDRMAAGIYGRMGEPSYLTGLDSPSASITADSRDYIGVQVFCWNGDGIVSTSENARGGVFSGRSAAVRLKPGAEAGAPAVGETGDLYVDSTGRLWYCRQGGSAANWVTLVG